MWTNRLSSTRFIRFAGTLGTALLLLLLELTIHAVPVVAAGECTVGQGYTTIQAAVDDAQCNSIFVPAGAYAETVVVHRDLSIVGAGADLTVVDGKGAGSVFFIMEDATVLLSGLTITGGTGSASGGDHPAAVALPTWVPSP
jgi:nitrous oxidase accessory protein NosD